MRRSFSTGDAHNHVRRRVNQKLHLQRMTLLFPAVVGALLFLGRSQGTSATSTSMAVHAVVVSSKACI